MQESPYTLIGFLQAKCELVQRLLERDHDFAQERAIETMQECRHRIETHLASLTGREVVQS